MRASHVFLPAVFLGILISSALAQAPKPVVITAPKPATTGAPKSAPVSVAPRPAGATGAKPATNATPKTTPPKEMTDEEKTIYALGLSMSRSLRQFTLSAAELDLIKRALTDARAGKPAIDLELWGPRIQGLAEARAALVAKREKEASAAYLAAAAGEPGAIKTASGLIYKELTSGTGASPTASDTVKVHYRGTLIDGTEFDSSYKRNEPAQFPLSGVIAGWTEGVQLMKVGGKARLICPSDLAYGDQGRPSIPGGATLVFEIELLEISGK
jgi:FKBP-type peptidyl-prolyl cis-trans isomerase FkpA